MFEDIVRAAILLLECLVIKAMQKVMYIAEKVIGKAADIIKEAPEEKGNPVHAKDEPVVHPERKKIPLPVNQQRKVL